MIWITGLRESANGRVNLRHIEIFHAVMTAGSLTEQHTCYTPHSQLSAANWRALKGDRAEIV